MDGNTAFRFLSPNNPGRRRKVQQRTKSGCLTCKVKRVKCDELKPVCTRCLRNSRPCAYNDPGADLDGSASLSVLSAFTVDPLTSLATTFSGHIIQHFQRNWDQILHIPGIYRIISLSQTSSLVVNVILAISACHLRHISLGNTQHRIAEHSYLSVTLQQYQQILDVPRATLDESGVESLLISAMLLNILTFPLLDSRVGYDQSTSWVFGPAEDLRGWLALQAGMKPLLISASAQALKTRSTLRQTMFGCDERNWPMPNLDLNLAVLPDRWIQAFNLDDPCSVETFGLPVAILQELQYIKPLRLNVFRNLLFIWKMPTRFRTLLHEKDERAVWLFGYWLGLLCRYEGAWWCDKRVRTEYLAISTFLDQHCLPERPGSEGGMWLDMMNELKLVPVFICT
ncbi:hypothetical protein BP6252_11320 [Coleophoma cylindrospora]|uniref:Zn(2)-C6 fungal-type domain-containing protein n=1 Tax=Coleophoma cylindrospora TaxID=1849047 RepID=A0A3D8QPP1_9HELO|nr:hypothetical protein BP6252_11320 [Coleophoma cylindrospora]